MLLSRFLPAVAIAALSILPAQPIYAWPQEFLAVDVSTLPTDDIAKAWGLNPKHASSRWAKNDTVGVQMIACTSPGNVVWPGEKAGFTFQFSNLTDAAVATAGRLRVVQYELFTKGDDVFALGINRVADCGTTPFQLTVDARGWADVTVTPDLPERKGGYALILELDGQDALFGAGVVRTFKPKVEPRQFYRLTMDMGEPEVLTRLGTTQNRIGFGWKPPSDPDFEAWYERTTADLRKLRDAKLPVAVEFGAGDWRHRSQPLGRPRPWLNDKDEMQDTKSDMAWLPSYDAEFTALVKRVAMDFGWPKGPVNAMKVWNEPWNGISISGWGADDERYREIYGAMCLGVEQARKEGGVQVLMGGCDSSSNTFDKLFADGTDTWLGRLDFLSIHYQGNTPNSTVKQWKNRKGPDGKPSPVLIWDTESWVANSDDRVAGVLAGMFAFGQDRVVGIQGDNVVSAIRNLTVKTATGSEVRRVHHTWSVGASVGAFQHFVGERSFKELLFRPGLPTAMQFTGSDPEDVTIVVAGDLGTVFGHDNFSLRTCRSLAELQEKEALRAQLKALPADSPERAKLVARIAAPQPFRGCSMTVAADARYGLYDFYGNPVEAKDGKIVIPLDARGFYLCGDGKPGSAAALVAAIRAGRIDGLAPVTLQLIDATAPVGDKPGFTLVLTNVLNRPVQAKLTATVEGLTVTLPASVALKPGERVELPIQVSGGAARPDNRYAARIVADFAADGVVAHEEDLRVNQIAKRTIAIDGKLDDWKDVLPQPVEFSGQQTLTLTEKAWLPFMAADETVKKGMAVAWLAHDADNFYFAARINDTTPHPGMPRFADKKHEEAYFYPEISYQAASPRLSNVSMRWTGQLTAPATGDYELATQSDDGVRLKLDGKELFANWTGHGPTIDAGKVHLEAGKRYDLVLEYFQGGGGAMIKLLWTPPGKDRTLIPSTALSSAGKPGLACEVFRGTDLKDSFLTKTDAVVDFTWGDGPLTKESFTGGARDEMRWPDGVRRFSYRRDPVLPSGNNCDNVQIAFNVLPPEAKKEEPVAPGTYPGFINVDTSDYEYALNTVAEKFGGGTEVWRLRRPDMPIKHFYPRQPASPADGAAPGAKLVTSHVGATRIIECSIPWSDLPEVKAAMLAGKSVKFSYRVNDNAGVGCLELARGRSISKRGCAFYTQWAEHWENQLAFGWGK